MVRIGTSSLFADFRRIPARLAVLSTYGFAVNWLLGFAYFGIFRVCPYWLDRRPYDDSILSSFWVRVTAQVLLSFWFYVWGGRVFEFFIAPFLAGWVVARLSRGHEVAACSAFFALQLVIEESFAAMAGHWGLPGLWRLGIVSLRFVAIFAAAWIVARRGSGQPTQQNA